MTATVTVSINPNTWVLVAAATSGTLENPNVECLRYRVDTSLPDPSVTAGHKLEGGETLNFSFASSVNIYMRSYDAVLDIIYTEG